MTIEILFNSGAAGPGYSTGWGFSALVGERILFDTGADPAALARNSEKTGVDPARVEAVVISHDHADHTGGLDGILRRRPGLQVCICPGFSAGLKRRITDLGGRCVEHAEFSPAAKNIYVTGQMSGTYRGRGIAEQALVIDTDQGLWVVTGCAHPGIIEMLEKVRRVFARKNLYAVLGGFHLKDTGEEEIAVAVRKFAEFGIKAVGPTHCSGLRAERAFKNFYGNAFMELPVGTEIKVEA